jgi:hypothetical protein
MEKLYLLKNEGIPEYYLWEMWNSSKNFGRVNNYILVFQRRLASRNYFASLWVFLVNYLHMSKGYHQETDYLDLSVCDDSAKNRSIDVWINILRRFGMVYAVSTMRNFNMLPREG